MQQALDTLSVSISQLIHLGDIFRMGIPQKLRRNTLDSKCIRVQDVLLHYVHMMSQFSLKMWNVW